MKTLEAWIIIDDETSEPLLIEDRIHVFWRKKRANAFVKKWKHIDLSIEKVEIKTCLTK